MEGLNAAMPTHTDTRLLSNYIGGRWVASTSSDQLDVQNPATGETLARVPLSGAADVDAAVKAARAAFPAGQNARYCAEQSASRWTNAVAALGTRAIAPP